LISSFFSKSLPRPALRAALKNGLTTFIQGAGTASGTCLYPPAIACCPQRFPIKCKAMNRFGLGPIPKTINIFLVEKALLKPRKALVIQCETIPFVV
jgi:hypothetical protein